MSVKMEVTRNTKGIKTAENRPLRCLINEDRDGVVERSNCSPGFGGQSRAMFRGRKTIKGTSSQEVLARGPQSMEGRDSLHYLDECSQILSFLE